MKTQFKKPLGLPLSTVRTKKSGYVPYDRNLSNLCPTCVKILLIIAFVCTSCTPSIDSRIVEIDGILDSLHLEERFNGTILIAEKGAVIYEKSFGFSDYRNRVPLNSHSMFNVASVSKTFTGVALLQLVEKGKLQLNDDITRYFPQIPYENITIRNLLTHTSGLPRIQSQPFLSKIEGRGLSNEEIKDVIIRTAPKLRFAPGKNFFYANTNYVLLALIIERVSGKDFNQYLTQHIFEKCGMQHTFLKKQRVPDSIQSNIVRYYRKPIWLSDRFQWADSLPENIAEAQTFEKSYGPSDIHTTARDLLKFHNALQNETLLKRASLNAMYTPHLLEDRTAYKVNAKSNYPALSGLTWRIAMDSTMGKIVFHTGGLRGGRSLFMRNITKNQCVIMLTNNEENDRHTFTFPMRVLNNASYTLDKISLARTISTEYLKNGMEVALEKYARYENDDRYIPMIDFDFEEIGEELVAAQDYEAAIAFYKLYTSKFSDEYSWTALGGAHVLNGTKQEAISCFEKALEINSEYHPAKNALQQLVYESGS